MQKHPAKRGRIELGETATLFLHEQTIKDIIVADGD